MSPISKYDYYVCPECGSEVRIGSKGCPHCEESPEELWSLQQAYLHNIPPEEFEDEVSYPTYPHDAKAPFHNYEAEFEAEPVASRRVISWLLGVSALALLLGGLLLQL